jgi:hypothetical protein
MACYSPTCFAASWTGSFARKLRRVKLKPEVEAGLYLLARKEFKRINKLRRPRSPPCMEFLRCFGRV